MFIVAIILQLLFGFLVGFGGTWSMDLASYRETFVFGLGNVLGVWGVGSIFLEIKGGNPAFRHFIRFLNTLMGASFGALLVIQIDSVEISDDFVLPLGGAVIGYYFLNFFPSRSK